MQRPLLEQPERLEQRLKEIPPEPGCYLMRDADDRLLYVGKSKTLRSRVRSYFRSSHDLSPRIRLMVRQICEIEFIVTDSEAEALATAFQCAAEGRQKISLSVHYVERTVPAHFHYPTSEISQPSRSILWTLCGCGLTQKNPLSRQTSVSPTPTTTSSLSKSHLP